MTKTLLTLLPLFFSLFGYSQLKDIEKNEYKAIKIGEQEWMAKNLSVSRFNNGDKIFEAQSPEDWMNAMEQEIPAFCYYDFNKRKYKRYGKLYNGYALRDKRGLSPIGWHIATSTEWKKALMSFSMEILMHRLNIVDAGTHDPYGGSWGFNENIVRYWLGDKSDDERYLNSLSIEGESKSFEERQIESVFYIRCIKN